MNGKKLDRDKHMREKILKEVPTRKTLPTVVKIMQNGTSKK